jgi:hypothetical protein
MTLEESVATAQISDKISSRPSCRPLRGLRPAIETLVAENGPLWKMENSSRENEEDRCRSCAKK